MRKFPTISSLIRYLTSAACFLTLALPSLAGHAGSVKTWDGGGVGSNWTTPANWVGDTAPDADDDLIFPAGAAQLSSTNDFPNVPWGQLTLSGSGYILSGDELEVTGILSSQASGGNSLSPGELGLIGNNVVITVENDGAFLNLNTGEIEFEQELTFNGAGDVIIVGDGGGLEGFGTPSLIKAGTGKLTIAEGGNSGVEGPVTVDGGALVIDGILTKSLGDPIGGPIAVNEGAVLQGDGETDMDVNVNGGGEVRPGNSPGTLEVAAVTFAAESIFSVEINGPALGTEYSSLETTGNVTLNNSLLRIAVGPGVGAGQAFTIIQNGGGAVSGQFNDLEEGETFTLNGVDGIGFSITYQGGDGNDVVVSALPVLSISDATVQAPSSGTATASFTVTLSEASDETVTVQFQTQDGTAIAPLDYASASGTLTFNPGQTVQTVNVTVNSNSGDEDNDEIFFVALLDPSNAAAAVDEGTGTITAGGGDGGGCALQGGMSGRTGPWTVFGGLLAALAAFRRYFRQAPGR